MITMLMIKLIITQDADDLEFILKTLKKAFKEYGITINFNKNRIYRYQHRPKISHEH